MQVFGLLVFFALGGIFVWIGLSMRRFARDRAGDVEVELEVVDMESRLHAPTPTAADGRKAGLNIVHAPRYRVLSGPHEGQEITSEVATFPAAHAVGDRVRGHMDAKGAIVSHALARRVEKFGRLFIIAGAVIAVGGLLLMLWTAP